MNIKKLLQLAIMSAIVVGTAQADSIRMGHEFSLGQIGSAAKRSQNTLSDQGSAGINIEALFSTDFESQGDMSLKIPMAISRGMFLVSNLEIPYLSLTNPATDMSEGGLGDVEYRGFFTERTDRVSGWFWGLGGYVVADTASTEFTGYQRWSAGPALNFTYVGGPYVMGFEAAQIFDIGGTGLQKNNSTHLKADLNINFLSTPGTYVKFFGESETNWEDIDSDNWNDQTILPVGALIGTVIDADGGKYLRAEIGAEYYVLNVPDRNNFGITFGLSILY